MQPYRLTPEADDDLDQIWEYIARDNVAAADRTDQRLHDEMHKLAEMPGLGHRRPDIDQRFRVWKVYSYLVIYLPDATPLEIVRVIHGARDLPAILNR